MRWLKKYLLLLFLMENIATQTSLLGRYTDTFFYAFLAMGALLLLQKDVWLRKNVKTFLPFYLFSIVYVVYEFFVGSQYINQKTLQYLIAKITTFVIVVVCVNYNFRFYERKILYGLAVYSTFFIVYGMATGEASSSSERLLAGFTNSNTTSAMGAFVLGIMIFITKKWNWKHIALAIIGLYAILAGGSRAGVLVLGILLVMRYGFKMRLIMIVCLLYLAAVFLLPAIGLQTVGVSRINDTIEGVEGTNREDQREATMTMIRERPYEGWGFGAENQGEAALISLMGSHNGYLDTIKFMGIPMGSLWIAIYLFTVIWIAWKYHKFKLENDVFFAILIAFTFKTYYEALLVGVHEFDTNLIFYSMAICLKKISLIKNH